MRAISIGFSKYLLCKPFKSSRSASKTQLQASPHAPEQFCELCPGSRWISVPEGKPNEGGGVSGSLPHLQELLDAPQVVLVEDVGLLQEAAVLLVDLPQQVVEHQRGVRLLVGSVRPAQGGENGESWSLGAGAGQHPLSPRGLTPTKLHRDDSQSLLSTNTWSQVTAPGCWRRSRFAHGSAPVPQGDAGAAAPFHPSFTPKGEKKQPWGGDSALHTSELSAVPYQSWLSIHGARNCRSSMGKLSL